MTTMRTVTTISELADLIDSTLSARIVGVVGEPGSGKSTVTQELSALLTRDHVVIPMDGFHYPQATLRTLGRRDRMGAPDTFDAQELASRLGEVRSRQHDVSFPDFDRTVEERIVPDSLHIPATTDLILIEGNYLLHDQDGWESVREFIDFSIYVDTDEDVRLERLFTRHVTFGKDPDSARLWMESVDGPNADLIRPTQQRADVVFRYH